MHYLDAVVFRTEASSQHKRQEKDKNASNKGTEEKVEGKVEPEEANTFTGSVTLFDGGLPPCFCFLKPLLNHAYSFAFSS